MRQKRKNGLSVSAGWLLAAVIVLAAALVGMRQAGWIELNGQLGLAVDSLMFWKSGDTAAAASKPPVAAVTPAAEQAKQAAASAAPQAAQKSESQGPPPSNKPAASAEMPANQGEQTLVRSQSLTPIGENERAWLEQARELKLEPGKLFSLNDWVRETMNNKKLEAKEAELSHLAGMLYETALRAGLEIGERYTHQDLPAYAAAGFDVQFEPDRKNLTLLNPYDFVFKLDVAYNGQQPVLALTGKPSDKWSEVQIDVQKESFSPDKVMLVDYSAAVGRGEVKRDDGKDGLLVKVYKNGKEKEPKILLAKDYYAPHPLVVTRGPTAEEMKALTAR